MASQEMLSKKSSTAPSEAAATTAAAGFLGLSWPASCEPRDLFRKHFQRTTNACQNMEQKRARPCLLHRVQKGLQRNGAAPIRVLMLKGPGSWHCAMYWENHQVQGAAVTWLAGQKAELPGDLSGLSNPALVCQTFVLERVASGEGPWYGAHPPGALLLFTM